jgi:hypothetical protein
MTFVAWNRPALTDPVEDLWNDSAERRSMFIHGYDQNDSVVTAEGSGIGNLATSVEITGVDVSRATFLGVGAYWIVSPFADGGFDDSVFAQLVAKDGTGAFATLISNYVGDGTDDHWKYGQTNGNWYEQGSWAAGQPELTNGLYPPMTWWLIQDLSGLVEYDGTLDVIIRADSSTDTDLRIKNTKLIVATA